MDVIPVLDLKGGRALHARRGERAQYDVVRGVLGTGEDPVALAECFRDQLGLSTLYIADLDAIAGTGEHRAIIARLAKAGFELWVDAGIRHAEAAASLAAIGTSRVVVGLETLPSLAALPGIVTRLGADAVAFCIDLVDGKPLTPDPVLAATDPLMIAGLVVATGVRTIIVLDLARVGANRGPSPLIGPLRSALPTIRIVSGGGVRDPEDLQALSARGCAAALVATALHEGRIGRAQLDLLHPVSRSR